MKTRTTRFEPMVERTITGTSLRRVEIVSANANQAVKNIMVA